MASADTSNAEHTHRWCAKPQVNSGPDKHRIQKRVRRPLSCQICRSRKLKCDRGHPCSACTQRGEGNACMYDSQINTAINQISTSPTRKKPRSNIARAQERLLQLEKLVQDMVGATVPTAKQVNSIPSPPANEFYNLSPKANKTGGGSASTLSYTGPTHWSAVLDHITGLKHDIAGDVGSEQVNDVEDLTKPDPLFGANRPSSLQQVLQTHLPIRPELDRKISQYFNAKFMITPIVHSKRFLREYERFWQNPLEASIMWISLMFSMCSSVTSVTLDAESSNTDGRAILSRESFEEAAGHYLVLGNYSKPQPYLIEAFALFLRSRYDGSADPSREVALILSVQTRLAYMMGYHRDPSNFPGRFSAFETEMRRRTWATIKTFDIMTSFQMGLPSNVMLGSFDTLSPSNLYDSDFDEEDKALVCGRAPTEATQILYFVTKAKLVDTYSEIAQYALGFKEDYEEVLRLDGRIRIEFEALPSCLRFTSMAASITDQSYEIMTRLNLSMLLQKALCVLHRKHMASVKDDYSHQTCLQAAYSMCDQMVDSYPEYRSDGVFGRDGWMLTSFTIIDFLFVIMVMCAALSLDKLKFPRKDNQMSQWHESPSTKRRISLLEKCRDVCKDLGRRSREAKRAVTLLDPLLNELNNQDDSGTKGRALLSKTGTVNMNSNTRYELSEDYSCPPHGGETIGSTGMISAVSNNLANRQLAFDDDAHMVSSMNRTMDKQVANPVVPPSDATDLLNYMPNWAINQATTQTVGNEDFAMSVLGADWTDWTQIDQFIGFSGGSAGFLL